MELALRSHVVDADSYFNKKRATIDKYRNRSGGHLDADSIRAGIPLLDNVAIGRLALEEPRVGNFVLKNYFAVGILEASIISHLDPGTDLAAEYRAILETIANSINHAQRATQALVYWYLWPKFG